MDRNRQAVLRGFALLLALAVPSTARAATLALEPREAQFVFVIDDSGSMGHEAHGRTDPDRLAVFAVRALLGALDVRDWASIIRINGSSEGEIPVPLAPLDGAQRERLKGILSLDGSLAAYNGGFTPCRTALHAAFDLLNGVDRPDVSQVVIFLTDGKCTGQDEERVTDLLAGLHSHRDERFQFYLLRFQGTQLTPDLEKLAKVTGGSAIELHRGDPTRILNTFALALSRSQGYESQILTPANADLPAHRGARRVRLLAVAPGDTPKLTLTVSAADGRSVAVEPIDAASHHFEPDGRKYRFASASYAPTGEPVQVEVHGAGDNWEVVALPEYHLAATLAIYQGRCGEEGAEIQGGVGAGSDLCAVIRVVNESGRVVGQEITSGRLQGIIEHTSPSGDPPQRITATPNSEGEAHFRLDLRGLKEGYHTLRAEVQLTPPDGGWPRILSAGERTLQAVDRAIKPQPTEIDFDDVAPGYEKTLQFGLQGNFAETEVHVDLVDADRLSTCVTLRFADQPLGSAVKILPGQTYPLHLAVAEECDVEGVFPVNTDMKVRLDELPEVGTITVPVSWRLDSTVRKADLLRFELKAGSSLEGTIHAPPSTTTNLGVPPPDLNQKGEVPGAGAPAGSVSAFRYDATLDPLETAEEEQAKQLRLGFLDENGEVRMLIDDSGEPVRQKQVEITADRPLRLRVEAQPCCGTGVYRSHLRLRPVDGGGAVVAPVEVVVVGSWWTCYRSWVIAGLVGLLAFLLVFYVLSMFAHTHLLPTKQLAARLIPLHWPRYGGAPRPGSDRGGDREVVEDIVRVGMRWRQRVMAWLRANPLVFGLPRRKYRETAELHLGGDFDLCSLSLVEERDIVARLQNMSEVDPSDEGRLFARAGSGVNFFAVRGPKGVVGAELNPVGWHGRVERCSIESLPKGQRLIQRIAGSNRKEGHVGGWELG